MDAGVTMPTAATPMSRVRSMVRAVRKGNPFFPDGDAGNVRSPSPPTGLADGFGLEESPYHERPRGFTPTKPGSPARVLPSWRQDLRLGGHRPVSPGGGRPDSP